MNQNKMINISSLGLGETFFIFLFLFFLEFWVHSANLTSKFPYRIETELELIQEQSDQAQVPLYSSLNFQNNYVKN